MKQQNVAQVNNKLLTDSKKCYLMPSMKLTDYLNLESMTHADFARLIEVSREAVRLWTAGERTPRKEQMQRIMEVTDGQVTPNDFLREPA
jgi:DNA-binding transcriptional regulator YiaG